MENGIQFSKHLRGEKEDLQSRCVKGIEELYALISNFEKRDVTAFEPGFCEDKDPHKMLGEYFRFIHAQYLAKLEELIRNLVLSANAGNYLVFSLCGRSIIEATAYLRYYNRLCIDQIEKSAEHEKMANKAAYCSAMNALQKIADVHMRGGQFDWLLFFTSDKKTVLGNLIAAHKARIEKKPKVQPTQENPLSIPIGRALDSWAAEEGYICLAYDFFSEMVHPNLGSNMLLMGIDHGKLTIGGNTKKSLGLKLCIEGIQILTPCLREASRQLADSTLLAALGEPIIPPTLCDEAAEQSQTHGSTK